MPSRSSDAHLHCLATAPRAVEVIPTWLSALASCEAFPHRYVEGVQGPKEGTPVEGRRDPARQHGVEAKICCGSAANTADEKEGQDVVEKESDEDCDQGHEGCGEGHESQEAKEDYGQEAEGGGGGHWL